MQVVDIEEQIYKSELELRQRQLSMVRGVCAFVQGWLGCLQGMRRAVVVAFKLLLRIAAVQHDCAAGLNSQIHNVHFSKVSVPGISSSSQHLG